MLHTVLNDASRALRQLLEANFPSASADWWKSCVLDNLSFQQRRLAEEKGISSLDGLDLAALLRVTEQNWREIGTSKRYPVETRNWLKEAQTIRNRWAHLPPSGLPPADVYRDADTLHRLITAIGADGEAIARADEVRGQALKQMQPASALLPDHAAIAAAGPINKGDLVRLKAKPDCVGAVVDGCEGLDYQFCDALVNYDLPWNPMRVEQRIGRIDRYGQKSETVVIYNLITPGTVDAEIYERCLLRIGVFRQALGGSEEILGRLTRELREIAENLTLSPEELSARLQQVSDNEVRAIQEQARLEEEQSKLFGLSLPKRDEDMIRHASSFWLAPPLLANLIARYLEAAGVTNLPPSFGQKRVITLQIGQEIREKLLADFMPLNQTGVVAKNWERWLKGNDPYLAFTFDQSAADERRELAFITPTHPLARQAARSLEPASPLFCSLTVNAGGLPTGHHPFAIYRWRKLGLREDFTFQPVCANPEVASRLLELLENAQPPATEPKALTTSEEDALEQSHYRHWLDARAQHIEAISQIAQARLASLKTTHAARLSVLEDQRDQAADSRIIRMRDAQIESAKRDYDRRAEELKSAHERADIIAEPVVLGILSVR